MTTRTTRAGLLAALALALATTACSDDPELADITTIAPPAPVEVTSAPTTENAPVTTEATATTATSGTTDVATSDTSAPVATDAGTGATGPMFSDALGVKVDTAPGVNTPGDTRQLLPEGLYVHIAWAADPNDPSVFTVQPEDVEILEAYANAVSAYYASATGDLDAATPALRQYVVDPEEMFGRAFAQATEGGLILDLGNGVVLRPYIVGQDAESATVYDCYLEDEEYTSRASTRSGGVLLQKGQVATMRLVGGAWKVDSAGLLGSACL